MTMRIGDVQFPRELISAYEADTVVLFVGAGASMSRPSNLPCFMGLTKMIRDESQLKKVFGDLDKKALDEVLEEIEKQYDVDVHARVAAHIGRSDSVPNDLHKAIATLAASSPAVRIVTTNYDLHLSCSLNQLDQSVTEYVAPALPVGSDFSGLVYLHGCLRQASAKLVVTMGDFGRAYLTEAWAARFLERMYAESRGRSVRAHLNSRTKKMDN
jgi:NAD-dependent SIR2 family protein deacetylase